MSDTNKTQIEVNFFKPLPGIAKENSRLITIFVLIWAVAVFGFQFLLIGTNELVPEESLKTFERTWPKASVGQASAEEERAFAKSLLMAYGKNVALEEADRNTLGESFALSLQRVDSDAKDVEAAAAALELDGERFGVLLKELLPSAMASTAPAAYSDELPGIMGKYCAHPQGPLTNFKFIGFPFHYWYTAQFLLILFVVLCLLYAKGIEKIYKRHGFVEETD